MISTSQREHLTYTLIGQTVTLVAIWIISWQYIIPGISKINTSIASAEEAINSYVEVRDRWYEYSRLNGVLSGLWNKEELIKIIQATPEQTRQALQKTGQWEYLTWLKWAINASDEDRKKLAQAKKKINSILPTMSPMSANIDEENITLKEYIYFIENKILKKFELDSNLTLGINWLVYGSPANGMPSSVGTFDLRLDFKSTNAKIKELIDFINYSGDTDILSNSGVLSEDQIPEIMSNPLMTMEALSLQDPLDIKKPDEPNSGRVTIRFYVRWASKDDVTFLRENLRTRQEELGKKITTAVSDCQKNEVLCSKLDELKIFQKKYDEYMRGVTSIDRWWVSIDDIYTLSQRVNSVRTLEAEFDSFNTNFNK